MEPTPSKVSQSWFWAPNDSIGTISASQTAARGSGRRRRRGACLREGNRGSASSRAPVLQLKPAPAFAGASSRPTRSAGCGFGGGSSTISPAGRWCVCRAPWVLFWGTESLGSPACRHGVAGRPPVGSRAQTILIVAARKASIESLDGSTKPDQPQLYRDYVLPSDGSPPRRTVSTRARA